MIKFVLTHKGHVIIKKYYNDNYDVRYMKYDQCDWYFDQALENLFNDCCLDEHCRDCDYENLCPEGFVGSEYDWVYNK